MAVDFIYKLVFPDGTTFNYASPFEISSIDTDSLSYRIPTGETPGNPGEFADPNIGTSRVLSYTGTIVASTAQQLRDYWDTFQAGHNDGTPVAFYRHSDRLLPFCQMTEDSQAVDDHGGSYYKDWRITLRSNQPYYYDANQSAAALSIGGTSLLTVGGNVRARPQIQLNFTAPGTATVSCPQTGQSFFFSAPSAGVFTIDSDAGLAGKVGVSRAGIDWTQNFYGQYIELPYTTGQVSVAMSGGGAASWGTAIWQKRYKGA